MLVFKIQLAYYKTFEFLREYYHFFSFLHTEYQMRYSQKISQNDWYF